MSSKLPHPALSSLFLHLTSPLSSLVLPSRPLCAALAKQIIITFSICFWMLDVWAAPRTLPSPPPYRKHTHTHEHMYPNVSVCVGVRVCVSKSSTARQIKISYAFGARRAQRASRPLSPTLLLPLPAGHAPHLTRAELQWRQWQLLRHNLPPFQASSTSPLTSPGSFKKSINFIVTRTRFFLLSHSVSLSPSLALPLSLSLSLPPSLCSALLGYPFSIILLPWPLEYRIGELTDCNTRPGRLVTFLWFHGLSDISDFLFIELRLRWERGKNIIAAK